ncbi:metallophosphoesterase [Pedococcus sp.]|uniref:metallophosphoesterase family protein n=1 Tax=Pedococcus sp. TaxID=2860345 RepID=UPI002E1687E9|nr:metallophosphoesterase [Pedococcus sp.]
MPRVLRWLMRGVGLVVLFVACNSGGVAATTLFPSTADTLNYAASLHLSISPADLSALQSPTVFGTIRVSFAGPVPAPGVLAQVQVKERITDLLSRPGITVSSLEPGPLELEHAARDAVIGLGWRFAIGSLCVALLFLMAYAGWRHRRLGATAAAVVAAVWVASCVATFGVLALTYQPDRLDRFTTTGLLGAVQRTPELLAGVETRAQETTPYLTNLLALSAALQDKYRPQVLNTPTAARFLLVSDVHGANQYPLMRTIVQQEHIDAVIDSGDLVNFGSAAEAQAAGMFQGIRSLGVPYLFVKGNHDARSATDHGLLDKLATVPNVVLLEPDASTYTVEAIHGIRIAGFNDPRWFGDDNQDNAAKQKPAADRFNTAMADRPVPDIVVAHEPAAAEDVTMAGIRVNGHMHIAELDGTRIGVGTFTGGGPFSHFITEPGGGELTGQPSAFDIATFGEDCRLTALTRYQFRNVIEGRPAYDDVTLVNGSRIEVQPPPATAPAAGTGGGTGAAVPARTCSATLGPTTERVPAPSP